jgi:phage terminase Nu1 subunit (DNA packaging protein)
LGYRHITGVKSWGPEAKAIYLKQLFERHTQLLGDDREAAITQVAKMVGTKKNIAKKTLASLALLELATEQAFWDLDINRKEVEFSVLSTALSYESISSFIGLKTSTDYSLENLDEANAKDLFNWLFSPKKKVAESRQLKTLAYVLESKDATEKLRLGRDLEDAALFTKESQETFVAFTEECFFKIQEADKLSARVDDVPNDTREKLKETAKISNKLYLYYDDIEKSKAR